MTFRGVHQETRECELKPLQMGVQISCSVYPEVSTKDIESCRRWAGFAGFAEPDSERKIIASVSGDGAYDTKRGHTAIADRDAEAIIPVRMNGKPWKENTPGAKARNETLRATQRLGRTLWKKRSGYHRCSLVKTNLRCFKLLGERVNVRLFDSQVAELQIRAALLNRFTQLGSPITVATP